MLPLADRLAAALCPTSPTGKHHWVIPTVGVKPIGICKYCSAERPFENSAGNGYWDFRSRNQMEVRKYIERMEDLGN